MAVPETAVVPCSSPLPGVKSVVLYSIFHSVSESPAVQIKSADVVVSIEVSIPVGVRHVGDSNMVTTIFE